MNNVRCPQCGFTNFVDAQNCKRCNFVFSQTSSKGSKGRNWNAIIEQRKQARIERQLKQAEVICRSCGHAGDSELVYKVPVALEVSLFLGGILAALLLNALIGLFLILMFIVYAIIRQATKYWACENCQSEDIIPASSPMASSIMQKL